MEVDAVGAAGRDAVPSVTDPQRTIAGPFLEGLEQPGEAPLDGVVGDAIAKLA
jgi:hypothetical protein